LSFKAKEQRGSLYFPFQYTGFLGVLIFEGDLVGWLEKERKKRKRKGARQNPEGVRTWDHLEKGIETASCPTHHFSCHKNKFNIKKKVLLGPYQILS